MPWQEASAAGEQRRFIEAWLRGEETVAALCRRFGISRKTGYKRINRFKAWGYAGLGDRSRAPHTHPQATSADRTTDGTRIDPLTVQDAASRYLLACRGLTQPRGPQVRRVLERVLREYGLPRAIRTDNGPPFASLGLGGLTPLAVWWIKLGITPERIAPGHPEQNGRLERLHRTLKAETTMPPKPSHRSQQRAFDAFRHGYNDQRPHEALGQRPPGRLYRPSDRAYPRRLRSPEYGQGVTVRKVRTNGQIRWHGALIYLSETLHGEPVGLVPQDDRYWTIQYGPVQLGRLDAHTGHMFPTATKVLPMSPV